MKTLAFYSLLMCLLNLDIHGQEPGNPHRKNHSVENFNQASFLTSEKESLIIREKNPNEWSFTIEENYAGEFVKDPAGFVIQNFKVGDFLGSLRDLNHEFYDVVFKCKKGYLKARYSRKGELVEIYQNFEDVPLPRELRHQLYRDYKGWEMITNKSVGSLKEGKSNIVVYRIKLKNGDRTKIVKIPSESTHFPGSIKI